MTPQQESTQQQKVSQTEFHQMLREKLREAVRFTLIEVLEAEVAAHVGAASYERTSSRRDYRNGSYSRNLGTGVGQASTTHPKWI